MATRVALYTRVSTEDQAKEGFSLDAQLDRLRFYAKAQGWEIAGEYVDEGHSGRTTKRPRYKDMMDEKPKWDTLLVLKMDRIHRNSRNFMAMMDDLRKHGKEFASVTESLDTSTAMGRFVMDIIQRIAQLESDQIGERTYIGMEQKAKVRGGSLGKPAPFGYDYGPERVLVVKPDEKALVSGIFSRYLQGASKRELAAWANQQPTTRDKAPWTVWTVDDVLGNPTYAGALRWGKDEKQVQFDMHEAIVDPKTYDAVQDRLDAARRKPSGFRLTRLASPKTAVLRK